MNAQDAKKLALELMEQRGLLTQGWEFGFDSSKRRFGQCRCRRKQINLSFDLVCLNNESQVRDTILHEIAHALCPVGVNHGWEWKQKAYEVGCSSNRCYSSDVVTPEKKYIGTCPVCKSTLARHKRHSSRLACTRCCRQHNGGRWDERFVFVWSINSNV